MNYSAPKSKHSPSRRKQWLKEAIVLQEIENNPFTPEQITMFEKFDHENWSDAKCLEYIKNRHTDLNPPTTTE